MKLLYYPGCSLEGTARDYDDSIKEVARLLELELEELEDWNCCGASSAHMTDHALAIELSMRNLMLAKGRGADLLVPCSACFQRLCSADHALRGDPQRWGQKQYEPDFEIIHLTNLLARPEHLERIAREVKHSLKGLKLACYYGCLSLRPPLITGATDHEDPRNLERIISALGAEPVRWSHKTECCSGSLTMARPDIARQLVSDVAEAARHGGAKALVTDCPMCQANLESRQVDGAGKSDGARPLPVFFATELVAAALEEKKRAKRWKGHLVPIGEVMEPLGL